MAGQLSLTRLITQARNSSESLASMKGSLLQYSTTGFDERKKILGELQESCDSELKQVESINTELAKKLEDKDRDLAQSMAEAINCESDDELNQQMDDFHLNSVIKSDGADNLNKSFKALMRLFLTFCRAFVLEFSFAEIQEGDQPANIQVKAQCASEIESLTKGFIEMTEGLKEAIQKIWTNLDGAKRDLITEALSQRKRIFGTSFETESNFKGFLLQNFRE